ncbi:hypothetical protein BJ165DRAFT_1496111 [Panaeolus papilionaceus]|nr:hypothetical protein BJ165DRAFT_1496111 [Panaeolus papilionaceus]
MVSWTYVIFDIKSRVIGIGAQDTAQRVKLEWKASKRTAKRKCRLAKARTDELRGLVKRRWTSLVEPRRPRDLQLISSIPPHLYSTNDAPTDNEVKLVHEALQGAERERKRYADEMQRRAVWELLECEVQHEPVELKLIDEFVHELKGVVSPTRRLPAEILQFIFLQGSYDHSMRTYSPKGYHPELAPHQRATGAVYWPWSLSQVSRSWRQVCLATPELWNYLPPLVLKKIQATGEKQRERRLFSMMIERSRNASLHGIVWGFAAFPVKHPILEMLIQESDRWETMTLKLNYKTFNALFHPIKHRLQRLRYLEFHSTTNTYQRSTPVLWDMFSDVPCLRHVDFSLYLSVEEELAIGVSPALPRAVNTFVNNPNLHTLCLSIYFDSFTPSPMTLPHLKRLNLNIFQNTTPITLNALTLPGLEEFVVVGRHHPATRVLPTILSLFRRSAANETGIFPLKKLHLKLQSAVSDLLISIVELVPQLMTLEMPLTRHGVEIMERLSSVDPLMIIAPNLEYCHFHHLNFPHPSLYNWLNQLAKSRCYDPHPSSSDEDASFGVRCGEEVEVRLFKYLKSLTLECDNGHVLRRHQRGLEDLNELSRSRQTPTLEHDIPPSTLGELSGLLSDVTGTIEMPGGNGRSASSFGFCVDRQMSPAIAADILRELKGCIKEDVNIKDIYIPQVHLRLQAVQKWIESNMAGMKRKSSLAIFDELQRVAKYTLDTWYFMLDEYTPKIHWVAISTTVLMYVPSDHPFRSSSDSINLARVYDTSACLEPFHEVFSQGLISDDL